MITRALTISAGVALAVTWTSRPAKFDAPPLPPASPRATRAPTDGAARELAHHGLTARPDLAARITRVTYDPGDAERAASLTLSLEPRAEPSTVRTYVRAQDRIYCTSPATLWITPVDDPSQAWRPDPEYQGKPGK